MNDFHPPIPLRRQQPSRIYRARVTAITTARCRHSRAPFGVHFTRNSEGIWVFDHAFRLSPHSARSEGQDLNRKLRGSFGASADYPGCPFCQDRVLFQCGCGRLTCFVTDEQDFKPFACAWCNTWVTGFSMGWDSLRTTQGDL